MILHVGKHCGQEEESWPVGPPSSSDESGALFDAYVAVLHQLVQMSLVVLRTVLGSTIQWVTNGL